MQETVFEFSSYWKKGIWFAFFLFAIISLLGPITYYLDPSTRGLVIFAFTTPLFLLLTFLSIYILRFVNDRLIISDKVVRYEPRRGETVELPWDYVAEIRERPLLQRFDIIDITGVRAMKIEFQMGDVEMIMSLLGEYADHAIEANRREFYRCSYVAGGQFVVISFMLGFAGYIRFIGEDYRISLLTCGLGLLLVFELLRMVNRVGVYPEGVVLYSRLWRRSIPYEKIQHLELTTGDTSDSVNFLTLVIKRKDAGENRLSHFREGILPMHKAIQRERTDHLTRSQARTKHSPSVPQG